MPWPFNATSMLGLLAALMGLGCRSAASGAAPQECAPVTSALDPASSAEGYEGDYMLRLVATSGNKSGSTTEGKMKLLPQRQDLRYRIRPGGAVDSAVVQPLYGPAELDLDAVDAVQVGTTASDDPMQPGVLVVESHARAGQPPSAQIVLRFGSEANRRDRQRIDGGYTALRVRKMSSTGFSGTWASGITRERSAGYFCATRR